MADIDPQIERPDRCPGPSYTDMLLADTRPAPDYLLDESTQELGDEPLSTERYTSAAFKALEDEKMWPNVWQFAAREEDMPEPGDTVVYDIGDKSFLLIRQQDRSVRAFYNVCLHRGRKLKLESGPTINLRCPFHGMTWNNDGSMKEVPCQWDFKHLEGKDMSLPELKVDRWQGFILVTENHGLPSFRDWVGPGVEHFDNWRLDECFTAAWVGKVIPANWKAVSEAFMEAWHSVVTHPQILGFTADANTRYDLYGDHMNRAITASAALSPHLKGKDQFHVFKALADFTGTGDARARRGGVQENEDLRGFSPDDPWLARKVLAESGREAFGAATGLDFSVATDSEMLDNLTYNVFPNWSPWGGFAPNILYRWRPLQDADHCLMEVRLLMRIPKGEKAPKSAPMHLIPDGEPFASAGHLIGTALAGVFDQDMANLPYVQQGMKGSHNKRIELGHYQETRIRQFHRTMDKYISGELPKLG
jgi:phenylpropionate dioxygenase-like ring-hydroxylating dioxygenase large terminal subunit